MAGFWKRRIQMINVKDAKETRKKVEEIKARRNNKTISKKSTTKKRVKKETKKESCTVKNFDFVMDASS